MSLTRIDTQKTMPTLVSMLPSLNKTGSPRSKKNNISFAFSFICVVILIVIIIASVSEYFAYNEQLKRHYRRNEEVTHAVTSKTVQDNYQTAALPLTVTEKETGTTSSADADAGSDVDASPATHSSLPAQPSSHSLLNSIAIYYESVNDDDVNVSKSDKINDSNDSQGGSENSKVKSRFLCALEAAAHTTSPSTNSSVFFYAEDVTSVHNAILALKEKLSYHDTDTDWFSNIRYISTKESQNRAHLFENTPLAHLISQENWLSLPGAVRGMAVRVAHLYLYGGIAVKYDSILINAEPMLVSSPSSDTNNSSTAKSNHVTIFEAMLSLASQQSPNFNSGGQILQQMSSDAGNEASYSLPANVGLLSWFDARQVIIGDAVFVFSKRHLFLSKVMENFIDVYVMFHIRKRRK